MNYTWEMCINIFESIIFFIFISGKLPQKQINYSYFKQSLMLLLSACLTLMLNIKSVSPILTILSLFIFHCFYSFMFYSASYIVHIFWMIVFSVATVTADALSTIIPTNLFNIEISYILAGGNLRIPFSLLYIILLTVLVLIILCFSSVTFKLSFWEKIIFLSLSILCIIIEELIVVSQTMTYTKKTDTYMPLLYVLFFLVLTLFIAMIIYVYNLGIERDKNIQLSNLKIISEMEQKQYEQIISSISELRYIKHDINNHLETLCSLISNKEYLEAENFIQNLSKSVNNNHYILASGNSIIDSIITNKLLQCKASKIMVQYSIFLPDFIPLSDIELCSVLGNLFDNAIEACRRIPKTNNNENMIYFCIKPFQDMLSIMISNQTDGNYKTDKYGNLLSIKDNYFTTNHGLGLSRIKNIIETHGGVMKITPEEYKFTVSILLPLSRKEDN